MQSKLVLAAVMLFSAAVTVGTSEAGTTQTYNGQCQYRSSDGKSTYSGECEINAGIVGPGYCGHEYFFERYILTLPGDQKITIYTRCDGTGFANGIGSVSRKRVGAVDLVLTNGETFSFTDKSEWSCEGNCLYYYPELNKQGADNRPDKSTEPAVQKLISLYWDLNGSCRGGSGDTPETLEFCEAREKLSAALKTYGLCLTRIQEGKEIKTSWSECFAGQSQEHPTPSFFFGVPLPELKPK